MYKVSGMYLYNNMMTYYQNKNTQKILILEPPSVVLLN